MSMKDLGEHLYSFAVFGDTHINEAEDYSASPYPCNNLANSRARYIVNDINRRKPDFSIHLGDIINPIPHLPSYEAAAENAKEIFEEFDAPLYLLPGNHDIGDKPVDWMPAGSVTAEYIKKYQDCFGKHYTSFDYNDCHFVLLNTAMCNSEAVEEQEQHGWLEEDLNNHHGKRIFLFMHYPPYITSPDERGHYDNIDEPGRSWLLSVLEKYKVEALLAGHVHNLFYNRYKDTDCYILPSTCFVRHDFSEFYHIDGGDQNGRNDRGKLGYVFFKIFENGHIAQWIRSFGKTLAKGEKLLNSTNDLKTYHSFETHYAPVGLDMRHPWSNILEIPASGAVDEFERKRARNDYPLMAIWELGARKMRIPLQDLLDNMIQERIRILAAKGHEFTVYTYGIPPENEMNAIIKNSSIVSTWELVINWNNIDEILPQFLKIKEQADLTIKISNLRNFEDHAHGKKFNHFINYGFQVDEEQKIADFLGDDLHRRAIDGFVFRISRPHSAWNSIVKAGRISRDLNTMVSVYIRFSSENPAQDFKNDLANANRTAEAVAAAMYIKNIDIFLDSLIDIDRSYFARNGLYDRRFNPRLSSYVFKNLHAAMEHYVDNIQDAQFLSDTNGFSTIQLVGNLHEFLIVLPETETEIRGLPITSTVDTDEITYIDLGTGRTSMMSAALNSGLIQFSKPIFVKAPMFFKLRLS